MPRAGTATYEDTLLPLDRRTLGELEVSLAVTPGGSHSARPARSRSASP